MKDKQSYKRIAIPFQREIYYLPNKKLRLNGIELTENIDYTLDGNTIIFTTAPPKGSVRLDY